MRADGNEMATEIEFDAYFLCFPLVALLWITVNWAAAIHSLMEIQLPLSNAWMRAGRGRLTELWREHGCLARDLRTRLPAGGL